MARTNHIPSRGIGFGLFFTGVLWLTVSTLASARAAAGLSTQFQLPDVEPLLRGAFFLLLLMVGFTTLHWISTRTGTMRSTNALPARETAGREWAVGAAFGWGLALAVVLLLLLCRTLQPSFLLSVRSVGLVVLSLATLAFATLALEVAFRGYLYRRLIEVFGVVLATILLALFYAMFMTFNVPSAGAVSFVTTFVLGIVFSIAYQRTHALWLGWGMHFAWAAVVTVLFGLPLAGDGSLSSINTTVASGSAWLTGGGFGPEGSLLTLVLALAALPLLYRITRNFAWEYTHPEIVPGGYPMEAQPPAAHVAMEQQARPVPLVQIAGATPTAPSTVREIDEHLRNTSSNGGL